MTIHEIQRAVKPHKKCSKRHIYRFINQLSITPAGVRQRPQQYPQDTAARILAHLGFSSGEVVLAHPQPREKVMAGRHGHAPAGKLISVRALRAAKPQHKTKGTK